MLAVLARPRPAAPIGRPRGILDLHHADGVAGAGGQFLRVRFMRIDALRDTGEALAPPRDLLYTPPRVPAASDVFGDVDCVAPASRPGGA